MNGENLIEVINLHRLRERNLTTSNENGRLIIQCAQNGGNVSCLAWTIGVKNKKRRAVAKSKMAEPCI